MSAAVEKLTILVDRIRGTFFRKRPPTEEDLEHSAEAEIARNLWVKFKIFPPTSPRRRLWNMLMLYLVLYNCIQIPLSLAFTFEDGSQDGLDYFDIFIDSAFGIDIVLNFRTTFYEEEELVHDTKIIMKKYLYGWCAARQPRAGEFALAPRRRGRTQPPPLR